MKKLGRIRSSWGFTLIELLIVVAIIAILAAIAVPNFLEAQTRTKVSGSMADIRTLALTLEMYRTDWESYPHYPHDYYASTGFMGSDNPETVELLAGYTPVSLTTPVAYISSLPVDVFAYADADGQGYINPLQLYSYDFAGSAVFPGGWFNRMPQGIMYILVGVGPDGFPVINSDIASNMWHNNANEYLQSRPGAVGLSGFYDATNGTVSRGDIVYHGPGLGFEPSIMRDVSTE